MIEKELVQKKTLAPNNMSVELEYLYSQHLLTKSS